MGANPFDKAKFACYRDWEDALVAFLCHEALQPDVARWETAAGDAGEAKENAAFCALLLSSLLKPQKRFAGAAEMAYQAFLAFGGRPGELDAYSQWLRSGWVNVSRVGNTVSARLRQAR